MSLEISVRRFETESKVAVPLYDNIGMRYRNYRPPDPRIAAVVDREITNARTMMNVGAGVGSEMKLTLDIL
jgi:hypothetical protein